MSLTKLPWFDPGLGSPCIWTAKPAPYYTFKNMTTEAPSARAPASTTGEATAAEKLHTAARE